MKFVKTTVLGGVVFLVPVVILVAILGKAYQIMMLVAQPMSDWIPIDAVGGIALANILALLAIVLSCFLIGLLARSDAAKKAYRTLDERMSAIPGYAFVKEITQSMHLGSSDAGSFTPVIARFDDSAQISFEIERTSNGQVVVYLPGAPNPWSGTIVYLDESRVRKLDMSLSEAIRSIQTLGRGSARYGTSEPAQ
ncbi:MAG TPA: DUF502 domain-containing protein [Burkholderiales bacterium]|nr:DUF502 domain-containing protein [Burkholderiales bacterium]